MKNRIGWKTWICILLSALLLSYGCASRGVVYKPDTLEKTVPKTPAKVETPPAAKTEEAKERAPGYENLKSPEFKRPFPEKNLQKSPEPKQPFHIRIGREIPEGPIQILQVERIPGRRK